jgi:D-serine deaminase-like pyridoxal phosphate-dependent protein
MRSMSADSGELAARTEPTLGPTTADPTTARPTAAEPTTARSTTAEPSATPGTPRPTGEALRARYDRATAGLDPPLALVDLDAFDRNADDLTRRAAGRPIRVATKSLRCRYLIERALARPGYLGVMCYSLPEALWLHAQGSSDDLLVAYPTVDAQALRSLAADDTARQHITIMVDSPAHLDVVDRALGAGHAEIRVCLELDVSWRPLAHRPVIHIGTRRSPLHTPGQAVQFARVIVGRTGFRLVGLMGYEGQIEDLTSLEFVNGGGTGSLESTAGDLSVTELTAGSGLVGPTLFDGYTRFTPDPALLFALPVVRRPGPNIATLFSGGYVASGAGTPDRLPRPYLPEGLSLTGVEGAGEVQTPVRGPAAERLAPGDRVWLRHAKAGELAERFTRYHVLDHDDQVTAVPTYRGEGQCFG